MRQWDDLQASDWQTRVAASERLASEPSDALLSHLVSVVRTQHHDLGAVNTALDLLSRTPGGVPGLVELLHDGHPEVRAFAAQTLGRTPSRVAVPALVEALRDDSTNVCNLAAEALGRLGDVEAVPALIPMTASDDFFVAFAAVQALGTLGDARAVPALLALLPHEYLGEAAVEALGRVGNLQLVEPVLQWMHNGGDPALALCALTLVDDADGSTRAAAMRTLTAEQATVALERLGAGPGRSSASVAAWLAQSDWPEVQSRSLHLLMRLLDAPETRDSSVEALASLGRLATPALLAHLDGASDAAYADIVALLGRMGDDRALPEIHKLLGSPDPYGAAVGLQTWLQLRSSQDLQPLLDGLSHASPLVRQVAVAALVLRLDDALAARLRQRLPNASAAEKVSILRVLGTSEVGRPDLLASLNDPDPGLQRVALQMLGRRLGTDADAAKEAGRLLRDGPPSVRAAAARALAEAPPAFACPMLRLALQDADAWTRVQACRSLGRLGDAADTAALLGLGADESAAVRTAAAEALGARATVEAVEMLASLAQDPVTDVRVAAVAALGETGHPAAVAPLLAALDGRDTRLAAVAALAAHGARP